MLPCCDHDYQQLAAVQFFDSITVLLQNINTIRLNYMELLSSTVVAHTSAQRAGDWRLLNSDLLSGPTSKTAM